MQDKTPRDQRVPYTGRFADPNSGARKSGFEPARPRAASDAPRRPSGFAAAEPAKPRPAAPSKADEGAKDEKKAGLLKRLRKFREERPEKPGKIRNKRSQMPRLTWWEKLLIGVIILALLIILLALIFGGDAKTRHQMPRIERGGDSAYEPEGGATLDPDATVDYSQYLATPTPEAGAEENSAGSDLSGGPDLSQYLVTAQPGQSISDAAAAAGAGYAAENGDADGAAE